MQEASTPAKSSPQTRLRPMKPGMTAADIAQKPRDDTSVRSGGPAVAATSKSTRGQAVGSKSGSKAAAKAEADKAARPKVARRAQPKTLTLELMKWEGVPYCMYLEDYRIVGGKPWGGCTALYSWKVQVAQLKELLAQARAREQAEFQVEVFQHPNGHYAVYLDNVLLNGPRYDSLGARERRVGSVLVLRKKSPVKDYQNAHATLRPPEIAP